MKLTYDSQAVREEVIRLYSEHPELFRLYEQYVRPKKALEYAELLALIKEECTKPKDQRWIDEMNKGKYEFRIPPQDKNGVLRIYFELDCDCYHIRITGGRFKGYRDNPDGNRKRSKK
jgi:hypothetical protein